MSDLILFAYLLCVSPQMMITVTGVRAYLLLTLKCTKEEKYKVAVPRTSHSSIHSACVSALGIGCTAPTQPKWHQRQTPVGRDSTSLTNT